MLASGVLTVEQAYAAINYDTIMLRFGMMIVVANPVSPGSSPWSAQGSWNTRVGLACCLPGSSRWPAYSPLSLSMT
jgi:hypothetical protein